MREDVAMELGLAGRVYVVTGGSRGLGRGGASALVAEGARVVVSSRNPGSIDEVVAELGDSACVGVVADNADEDTPGRLVAAATDTFGRLDGALISVGGPPAGSVMEVTDEQWRGAFESVFLGAVRTARTLAASCSEGGAIAFVLSSSVRQPIAGLSISNGLRPGLAMVAKTMADELGPRDVRFVGLLPGHFDTERSRELEQLADDPASARAAAVASIPLRRYGTPEEFGAVAAFALSPAASYLTGVMIPVDGGALRAL
jgi:3-oxoacyl-[acyl-carrier protein] reductase